MTQERKYPPLSKHDHPDCHTMVWSESEMRAIKAYADAALALQAARHAEELLAYEVTVSNRDAEIERLNALVDEQGDVLQRAGYAAGLSAGTDIHRHLVAEIEKLHSALTLYDTAIGGQAKEIAELKAQRVPEAP